MKTPFQLDGKTILISGAAGILGSQYARSCLDVGANVVLLDVKKERLDELQSELEQSNCRNRIWAQIADCSSETEINRGFAEATSVFGSIDVVVNNATAPIDSAEAFFAPLTDFTLEEWRRQNSVNLDGYFLLARAAVKSFLSKQKPSGSIIHISSIMGVMGHDKRIYDGAEYEGNSISTPVAYAAAKAGVLGLMRWIAVEYADQGIRSNAIAPGGVYSGQNEAFLQKYGARIPLGRMAEPDELPGAMLYLASDASSYVTGQCLMVDGGLSAW
jgi:NAD(P)-dependent dehydrogenase (short-subunit alcohol dehydrogenase family)